MLDLHSIRLEVHGNLFAAAIKNRRLQMLDIKQGLKLSTGIENVVSIIYSVQFEDEQMFGEELTSMIPTDSRIHWWASEGPKKG